jgi:hypothetical protein
LRATSGLCDADEGAEVEHRLVPVPSAAVRYEPIGGSLRRGQGQSSTTQASQHPTDVGIDDGDVAFEGEHENRSRRVRTDAG